jgi:hypothetical protein
VINGKDMRDTMNEAQKSINEEINNKRQEFGLPHSVTGG